ncbi:MAG: glycosyltransferase [Mariprofundaceae bacterium]
MHQFFPDHTTGTEVLTLTTAKGMRQQGHEVAVFTAFPENEPSLNSVKLDDYMFEDIKVWRFRHYYGASEEQPNIVESEYNNRASARYFKEVLANYKPDIVHVYHFQRISASILHECEIMSVPVVFTPTDFWFMCPTIQLLLNDDTVCSGPDKDYANCLKHLAMYRSDSWKKYMFNATPVCMFSLAMKFSRNVNVNSNSSIAMAKALSLRESFLKKALATVDRILVPSDVMKRKIGSFLDQYKNFIDLPFGLALPKKISRKPSSCFRVGFIGTISHAKGPHVLTEAISLLPRSLNLEAHIYGDMKIFSSYSQLISKHAEHDDRIKLCGIFPFSKINEVFSELDVLIIPSIWHENTPLVAYAAQAYGCPIIASHVDGLSEVVIEGENGVFYTPGSAKELAAVIQGFHNSRSELEALGKQVVQPNSIDNYIKTLLAVYSDVQSEEGA